MAKDIIGTKKPRQRVLSDAEMREIWRASEATPYPFGPFVRMLLVTGQRLREVANATWAEFDFDRALWTIPAGRMKGDAAHEVPLSKLALEILRSVPEDDDKPRNPRAYVFSTMEGKAPISGFSKAKIALDRLLAETRAKASEGEEPAALPGWVFHDLRRTMRTNLSGLPVPDLVAELVIAHAKPGLHKVYDQHAYREEKKRALDLWAAKLLSIVDGKDGGNVVSLNHRVSA
jgi:integrase